MIRLLESIQQQAGRLYSAKFFAWLTQPNIFPLILFIFAFSVRAAYLCQSEHRVCQFGDAFYYLTTGALLAKAIASFSDWNSLLQQMTLTTPISPESGNTFLSLELPVRIILDGPIYPAYLALLASLFGFASQAKVQFENYSLQIGLANACVDVCSCLLIYFLGSRTFGRKAGAAAALLFALYPAASINLARAYSETVAYFLVLALLSTLLLARFGKLKPVTLGGVAILLGLLAASVALVRPLFVLVLAAIVVSLFFSEWLASSSSATPWYQIWCGKRRLTALLLSALGACMIFYPWTEITTKSLGKPTLLLSRAPAYNLFVGNQIVADGWKTWPIVPGFTGKLDTVVDGIFDSLQKKPLEMLALEFKKLPRLWAGGWNEFRYPFFGVSFEKQNIWHGMLLFFAFIGICLAGSKVRAERSVALTFVTTSSLLIILIHFLYIAFEPISRYAITAMPFVCLFAAVALVALFRQGAFFSLLLLSASSAVFFGLLEGRPSCAPILLQNFPNMGIFTARFLEDLAIVACWFLLAHICIRGLAACKGSPVMPQSRVVILLCFAFVSISWFSAAHFDSSRGEWFCDVRTQMQTFSQDATIPEQRELASWLSETKGENALDPLNTIFLLVDWQHEMGQPAVTLTVNRVTWRTVALPWHQVLGREGDIPTIFNMQGSAMTRDWRSFRQWWAIPIPRGLLKAGEQNEIAIGFSLGESPLAVRVYGDYFASAEADELHLPSFDLFSWTRGFATYDTRDTRIYQLTQGLCKVANPALWFVRVSETKDLSTEPGLQTGAYRIRFAMPRSAARITSLPPSGPAAESQSDKQLEPGKPAAKAEPASRAGSAPEAEYPKLTSLSPAQFEDCAPTTIGKRLEDITVDGGDPTTYMLFKESQKLPDTVKKGSIIDFGCQVKSDRKRQSGPITVIFEGENDKGELEKFTSPWQPTAVSCDIGLRRFHASYVVPEHMLGMKNLAVNVMASPFPTDELVLNKKKAVHEVLVIKDASLTLYTPLQMPAGKDLDWMIF